MNWKQKKVLITGAGGFIGIGRHDVAIPVTRIQDKGGRLLMPGATKDTIQSMPAFNYASDSERRDRFMAEVERDMTHARAKVVVWQQMAMEASAEAKDGIDKNVAQLQKDMDSAQESIDSMTRAGSHRWREFEDAVKAATTRLRQSMEAA